MGMKLTEVMQQGKPPSTADYGGHLLEGAVGPDTHEGYFRVYPNGNVKNRYFVLRSEDVAGDVYKWSDAELAHAGIVGQERYRITIKEGAVIHSVVVRTFRLGSTQSDLGQSPRSVRGYTERKPLFTRLSGASSDI